jgi:hypothetical protein
MNDPNAVKAIQSRAVVTGPSDGVSRSKAVVTGSSDDDRHPIGTSLPTRYQCGQCGKHQFKSYLYITLENPAMPLQGSKNLICRQCWNDKEHDSYNTWNQADWQKACDDLWVLRASEKLQDFKTRKQARIWHNRSIEEKTTRHMHDNCRYLVSVYATTGPPEVQFRVGLGGRINDGCC